MINQQLILDMYATKDRRGVRELVYGYSTSHYELFQRYVIGTNDIKFIKWFLTSSQHVYKDVVKGILQFHDYTLIHKLNQHNISLKHYLNLMREDATARDIVNNKIPYEKLVVNTHF